MGGRIWLDSEPGQGSTFHVILPLPESHTLASQTVALPPPELRDLAVLVVDDNATDRKILSETLRRWGCQATTVDGADSAIRALLESHRSQKPFELILTDAQMPERDGFMLIEAIRRLPELTQVAIMMLTSVQYADAERCRALGISVYLSKPVRQRELQEAILRVLGETRPKSEAGEPIKKHHRESAPPLRVLLVEDNAVNQKLAVALLHRWNYAVITAANGIEALAQLKSTPIDVVLMDLQMPHMDGFQTTAAIRREELATGGHLPIIGLTAHAMRGDRERCLDAGMDEYLSKPIRAEELKRLLHALPFSAHPSAQHSA